MNLRKIIIALLTLFAVIPAIAAPSIHISLRRGEAAPSVGQPFYITVRTNNVEGDLSRSRIQVPGAKVLYIANTQSEHSTTIINGQVSSTSSAVYTVTLRPEKEGTLVIPPIQIGGIRSNSLTVKVGKAGSSSGRAASASSSDADFDPGQQSASQQQGSGPRFIGKGNDNLFMVASINKTSAYENEALVYTVKLYSSFSSLRFIGATEAPKFNGFTLEDTNPKVESLHFESYKGKQYACAVIARYIIFPQMKGRLTIQGNRYTITAESRPEFWDPFWGVMSYGRPVQLSVQPNDLTVDVKPLPQPQPAGFSGGVGKFKISASMPTQRLATNEAASIVYTVTGSGNIKYITLPDLAGIFPKQFDVSTPTPQVTANPAGNTVSGTVKFDCSIMPLEEGTFEIPAVELVYFDPEKGTYETVRSRSFKVNVSKGKGGSGAGGHILKFDDKLMPYTEPLAKQHYLWGGSVNYWLLYLYAFAITAISLTYIVIRRRRMADTENLMARRARRMSDRLLRHARKSMKANLRERFFDQILTALWGYAAHKLRMQGSEMQRSLIEANFATHGVPQKDIDSFIEIIDRCEEAKYAGSGLDMQEVYDKAGEAIRSIDASFKK